MMTFVESKFECIWVYEFQAKGNSYEDICWVSVWSYLSLRVSNNTEFVWRYLLSFSFKLSKFANFKQKGILVKTFIESQFEVIWVYKFHTKPNFYEDICFVTVWSYPSLQLSNNGKFLWRHLFSLSLKLCKFLSFKQKRILMKAFAESKFEVI